MLTPRTMIDFVSAEPFRAFRMHMAGGRTFDIRHPEVIKVGRSSVTVYRRPDDAANQAEHWHEISLMLLESVEPLDTKTAAGSP
jgi:hypothetical protein